MCLSRYICLCVLYNLILCELYLCAQMWLNPPWISPPKFAVLSRDVQGTVVFLLVANNSYCGNWHLQASASSWHICLINLLQQPVLSVPACSVGWFPATPQLCWLAWNSASVCPYGIFLSPATFRQLISTSRMYAHKGVIVNCFRQENLLVIKMSVRLWVDHNPNQMIVLFPGNISSENCTSKPRGVSLGDIDRNSHSRESQDISSTSVWKECASPGRYGEQSRTGRMAGGRMDKVGNTDESYHGDDKQHRKKSSGSRETPWLCRALLL